MAERGRSETSGHLILPSSHPVQVPRSAMGIERAERKESGGHCLTCLELDTEVVNKDKDNKGLVDSRDPDSVKEEVERPYSIYTLSEKWFIVSMASLAALFSPLTANIYLPAIPTIAAAFNKSIESINLTVTVYMVLQGVSPMFWGLLADRVGRRPIFFACLSVLSAACVGLALVPTSDYWLLMLLRCLQAAGSASTVALGAGVIGDIATRAERGGFYGLFSLGPLSGPTFGPVIGGALAQTVGWRWIFWLLAILSAGCFLTMVVFLPETLPRLVGDGSIMPSRIYRPLVAITGDRRQKGRAELPPSPPFSNPLRILTYLDVINLLIFNSIVYSIFYAVTTTISTLFHSSYSFLNETDIGLCFLAIGGGTVIGGLLTGKLLDRDYRKLKEEIIQETNLDAGKYVSATQITKDENFPIEQARLRIVPFHLIVYTACCAGYGWCLEKDVNIAAPLALQIILAISGIAIMNTVQTLLIDLLPTHSSSVTACNNLVRCSMGAATVSIIELMLKALGTGWTYILLASIALATLPMIWFAVWVGPRCRARRRAKQNDSTL
ncbi:major facilitator superfamily domain-containing protein [Boletus edulis BED1]|uniref:Major facilitator superfamily domain-containing protein n=1 Tax=Boletus edulis BED1 TaxID=1328754 RepID=A0AAD4C146_BOLED|nr:major facilitator superfamily domain-containing protein [Boletus edulis BED1]